MFVAQERLRRNPKSIFLHKERPAMGEHTERVPVRSSIVLATLRRGVPLQTLFDMQEGKKFVPEGTVRVTVTPAQKALLDLINHPNAPDYSQFLKEVHELGTYYPEKDLVNLTASLHVHWLQEAIAAIAEEHFTNSKQA